MTRPYNGIELFREPFPHAIIEGAFPANLIRNAAADWPAVSSDVWSVLYDNPLERKRACNDWKKMPVPCQQLLNLMLSANLAILWDFGSPQNPRETPLIADASLWGGGLHSLSQGGHLDIHEDSDGHPLLGWHRRVNAILYLNPTWEESWGGALEFWDKGMQRCEKKIYPAAGRLVVFHCGDNHYHGVPEPLACPADVQRMTLAAFWFSLPKVGQEFKRPRARFVGRPGEDDLSKAEIRMLRARFDR